MTPDWSASRRQHKRVDLALEDVSGDGSFSGYASLFGTVDLGRDVIEPGAFAASLKRRGVGDVRMLYQHDPDQPIGRWLSIREDAHGLHVEGKLALGVARAREVHELMKSGALDGLSIGFQTIRARAEAKSGVRRILSADLWEISVVTFPMQPGARVTAVKAASGASLTVRDLERRLTRDAGLTRRQARGLIARGHGGLSDRQDAGPEDLERLERKLRTLTGALAGSTPSTDLTLLKGRPMTTQLNTRTGRAPETKSVDADISAAFEDFMSAFEHYKQTNEQRLDEIERRGGADVLIEEKMARIDQALDEQKRTMDALIVKRARPDLGRGGGSAPSAVRQAFDAYVRRGDEAGLRQGDLKAMSVGSDPDGGYLVPDELDTEIGRRLSELSPIRSIATVRQVSGAVLKKPFALNGMATGWVGETAARPQTATPQLTELQFPTMELYAMPAATASLIEDGALDIEGWIAAEVEAAFAEQEGAAYRHQGARKGVGCDCLGLVRGVWAEIIGQEAEQPGAYAPDWAERGRTDRLIEAAQRHCGAAIPLSEAMAGDILLFRWRDGVSAKHAGILSDPDHFIHAYEAAGVIESALVPAWLRRIAAVHRFPSQR
ncbi:MAG: phage major capsid protein [Hoeflea sp.]|nr:phage major capsid protein [Alphaproteobacteria bacterium]MBV1723056.1 phage major capsid protein [Hoeflea sp.]MBU4542552.1 phage major capsid protein [Alphaproteobacteria bacterium]MBU4551233.1 phage major capsid protein [Alphaproteobacteria bacterium]MBV1760067.1 phage major capsid protein [Hoeflea sp.]